MMLHHQSLLPDITYGIQPDATDAQIDEAYNTLLPWFVSQISRRGGIETLTYLMDRVGNPHRQLRVIHVGGTNGKGSTAEKIMEGLRSIQSTPGHTHKRLDDRHPSDHLQPAFPDSASPSPRVGLFTSPHIASLRERLRINGIPITKSDFIKLFYRVTTAAKHEVDSSFHSLSFFEMLTAMMFIYYYEGPNIDPFLFTTTATSNSFSVPESAYNNSRSPYCDYAVIEVGLGGRLDATNIIPASSILCAVITSIGWDHMDLLGSTLEEIAGEKAGILKPNCPVVLGPKASSFQSINDRISALGCYPVTRVADTDMTLETFDSENQRIAGYVTTMLQ